MAQKTNKCISKYVIRAIITLFALPTCCLALWLLLFVIVFISSKNTQYKRIGDTDFYLMHDNLNREGPSLFCNIKKGAFKGVSNSGKIENVYWNKDYILLECTKSADYSQHKIFCIIKQHVKSKKHDLPWRICEYNKEDYEHAKDSLKLNEKNMQHTNGEIPWRITLFENPKPHSTYNH